MAADKQPPLALVLLAAEAVHLDESRQKHYILGTFSTIAGRQFPLVYPLLTCYAELTDGHGETEVEIRFVDVDEEREAVFSHKVTIQFSDPLLVAQFVFRANGLVIPEPGEYRLQLWAASHLLLERRIQVGVIEGENDWQTSSGA